MNTVFILLGGNLGKVRDNFIRTNKLLEEALGHISQKTAIYQSEAWGFKSESVFLNQVVVCKTKLSAHDILMHTQSIEKLIGRKVKTQNANYSDRLIDIDILFYNKEIIETKDLIIPHPRLHMRRFTLMPLNEIIPNFIHPKFNKSIAWLNKQCEDKQICVESKH